MGKATTGLKAGAIAGSVYGIIYGIFSYLALIVFKSTVMAALQKEAATFASLTGTTISAQSLYNSALVLSFILGVVAGIVLGLILGAIFGAVYDKIPGKSGPVRGMIFGLILWIILNVLLDYGDIATYGMNYYLFIIGGGFVAALVYGYLAGALFMRWDTPPPQMEELQTFP